MNTEPKTFINIFFEPQNKEEIAVNSIEIPIIQRDYAQGRETKDVNRIRKQFINVLFNALIGKQNRLS